MSSLKKHEVQFAILKTVNIVTVGAIRNCLKFQSNKNKIYDIDAGVSGPIYVKMIQKNCILKFSGQQTISV